MLHQRLPIPLVLVLACTAPLAACTSSSSSWSSSSGSGSSGSYGGGSYGGSDAGYKSDASTACSPERLPGQTRYSGGAAETSDAKAADFDGDGHVDLVIADASGYRVYLNDALGVLAPLERFELGRMEIAKIAVGDFDGDGHTDLVLAGADFFGLGLGAGDGTFGEVAWTHTTTAATDITTANLDGDPRADLVARIGTKLVAFKNIDGKLKDTRSTYVGTSALVVGDFDEDKHADAAVLDSNGHVLLYRGDGVGAFVREGSLTIAKTASDIFAHDLDGDGHLDLVTGRTGQLVTLLGHGDLTFGEELYSQTSEIGDALVFADLDGDGHDDAAGASSSGKLVVLLGNGVGTVQSPRTYTVDSHAYRLTVVATADFDEDGRSDVVIDDQGEIAILPHGCR